jgi:hypothetical protein
MCIHGVLLKESIFKNRAQLLKPDVLVYFHIFGHIRRKYDQSDQNVLKNMPITEPSFTLLEKKFEIQRKNLNSIRR